MTDKERAEKYADDTRIIDENTRVGDDCISLVQDFEGNTLDIHERIKRAFLDGFNADRWHYPSKGEYPTEGEEVFCCLKRPDGFVKNWYETGYYNGQEWACNVDEDFLSDLIISGYKLEVIAWQYIIPPKEVGNE